MIYVKKLVKNITWVFFSNFDLNRYKDSGRSLRFTYIFKVTKKFKKDFVVIFIKTDILDFLLKF